MTQPTELSRSSGQFGNYDEIEQAVMETPRGRWFLNEYARRQRAQDLSGILKAMERLERALDVRPAPAADQVSSRITKAIGTIEDARQASPPPLPAENLEARQLKYFKKDEEIFAPAPPARPVAVPSAAAEPEPRGAKLVIRHADPASEPAARPQPAPAETAAQSAASAEPKRRIVIIRHKAGEQIDVPLQNELAHSA